MISHDNPEVTPVSTRNPWREAIRKYERPQLSRSLWQIATSLVPYVVICTAMYLLLPYSFLLVLLLVIPASIFLIRTFIVFHDCAHTSFFRSRRANNIVGRICALMVYTPFIQWRHEHAMHHASAGDLDRRGTGDITTWTIEEYRAKPWIKRMQYRAYRNPLILFVIGGAFFHLISQRIPAKGARLRDRLSVHFTTIAIIVMVVLISILIGPFAFLQVQLPIMVIAGMMGIWLFYVQHQFEDVYWENHDNWDYADAALRGSSYLKLPAVLQWCTGNIGIHHVHHLSSRIPNYALKRCHDENPDLFATVPVLTTAQAFRTMRLKLWDSRNARLVGWKEASLAP